MIRQCVLLKADLRPVGGRPLLAWLLREFNRYGVTEFSVPDGSDPEALSAVQSALPLASRISIGTPELDQRYLVCDGVALFDANLARLLRIPGAAVLQGRHVGVFDRSCVVSLQDADELPYGETLAEPDMLRRRALFLDRDGVINVDHGYVGSRERFEWVDGAVDAMRLATDLGWHVFIVTNQSGVARGLYSEAAVRDLLDSITAEVRQAGGTIDDVRFCPYHPQAMVAAYRQAHAWRKPEPGMLLDLIRVWELDAGRAVMVGDQATDMQAAAAAGIKGMLFPGGNLLSFLQPVLTATERQRAN